jgi:hypothetical protein
VVLGEDAEDPDREVNADPRPAWERGQQSLQMIGSGRGGGIKNNCFKSILKKQLVNTYKGTCDLSVAITLATLR